MQDCCTLCRITSFAISWRILFPLSPSFQEMVTAASSRSARSSIVSAFAISHNRIPMMQTVMDSSCASSWFR